MKKISCFVDGLEPWGVFIGVLLAESKEDDLKKIKSSIEFYNYASSELEKFFEIYEYNQENLQKWFNR